MKPFAPLTLPLTTVLLCACAVSASAASVSLEAPMGGWRYSSGENENYTQPVSYPAVTTSAMPGQSRAALIAGRIKDQPKAESSERAAPATLIVNGVAMPQSVQQGGAFRRPYAFNSGSNNVEVRAADGSSRRVQFYEGNAGRSRPRLRVVLGWDSDGTDLDLHVVSPDGQHVWYGERVVPNGGALDVDVTTGYGPEIYATPAPLHGTYLVYVNYYGSGMGGDELITTAQLTLVTEEGTPSEKRETFRVPLRRPGELTLVKAFQY